MRRDQQQQIFTVSTAILYNTHITSALIYRVVLSHLYVRFTARRFSVRSGTQNDTDRYDLSVVSAAVKESAIM